MADVDTREALTGSAVEPGDDGLWLGDALRFFLDAKRAGGRSRRTTDDYRKKLELFQRWVATRHGAERGSEEFDAPYLYIGADEVEAYVVHLKQERGMADSSRKNHLAVLRSFFQTISRRLDVPDPTRRLDEARFHQKAPKRSYLTRHEAGILLSAIEKREPTAANDAEDGLPVSESRRRTLAPALAARDHAAFSVMIYAGLRIEETTSLVLGDLSFTRGEEEVRVARGKGNKERVVPMSPKLGRSLKRYLKIRDQLLPPGDGESPLPHLFLNEKGERVTENTLRRRLYKWLRHSSIKKQDLKPHDLRRTFGTWYLQANPGHVRELAELMGHSDLSQVMKYALSDEQRARAGVARL
ncbi:MAG: tyrosine-type recombinase/integrase [Rubrobacteraceae bacterium]|nr:tyrosine-type recombinase/integrase [Rubrobacteraceae bacterium]